MKTTTIYKINIRLAAGILATAIFMLISSACSTGIESTKKIKMTRDDVKLMAKTPEQKLAETIQGIPLAAWEHGKTFIATSDRTIYIFDPNSKDTISDIESVAGQPFSFIGLDRIINPDLREECVILFSGGNRIWKYRTGKTTEEALKEIDSSKLPLMADLALIDQWKNKIVGTYLWTKSSLWYDEEGNRKTGLKFDKVKVEDIMPAIGDFPIKIRISDKEGHTGYLHMNYTADTHDSRNFATIFSLSDPKSRYPNIGEDHWSFIQRAKVCEGMTKDECKLAIGNPDEVRSGHNSSQTMDIWQYSDGTYLMFNDGLLTNFRQ